MINKYVIFSCGYNASDYVERHMLSVQNQAYKNYVHIIVDDASTDGTYEKILKYADDKTFVYRNEDNVKWISNALKYLDRHIESEDDIIVIVDLDDCFLGYDVLNALDQRYTNDNTWMTYSRFIDTANLRVSDWIPIYSPYQIKNQIFRKNIWSYTHLRTFKAFLWNELNKDDLKGPDGQYAKYAYDRFLLIPMLEMSSDGHIDFIASVQYIYNNSNPIQVEKIKRKEQEELARYVDNKPKYKILKRK